LQVKVLNAILNFLECPALQIDLVDVMVISIWSFFFADEKECVLGRYMGHGFWASLAFEVGDECVPFSGHGFELVQAAIEQEIVFGHVIKLAAALSILARLNIEGALDFLEVLVKLENLHHGSVDFFADQLLRRLVVPSSEEHRDRARDTPDDLQDVKAQDFDEGIRALQTIQDPFFPVLQELEIVNLGWFCHV